ELLELRRVHDLVELLRQLVVDGTDPVLDGRLDVLADGLARLDDLAQELGDVVLVALLLAIVEWLGVVQHLVEEIDLAGLCGDDGAAGGFRFAPHYLPPSGAAGASMPSCLASSIALSLLLNTSRRSFSSLSLPSILLSSCVSRSRICSSSLHGAIWRATA